MDENVPPPFDKSDFVEMPTSVEHSRFIGTLDPDPDWSGRSELRTTGLTCPHGDPI